MYTFGAFLAVGFLFLSAGVAHAGDQGDTGVNVYEEDPDDDCANPAVVQTASSEAVLTDQAGDECTEVEDETAVVPAAVTPQPEVLANTSSLALTGGDVVGLFALGAVAVALGGGFVLYQRRHQA